MNDLFFDSHCHVFSLDHIPRSPAIGNNIKKIELVLKSLGNLKNFVNDGNKPSAQIAHDLLGCYLQAPGHHVLTPLMVDFGHSQHAGDSLFAQQLSDLLDLKQEHPDEVFPFLAIDPRRPQLSVAVNAGGFHLDAGTAMLDVVKNLVGVDKPFIGVKLYPSMGFYPNDQRLYPVYDLCQNRNIPITAHCGNDHGLAPLLVAALNIEFSSISEISDIVSISHRYCEPRYWQPVLAQYPNLRLDLAHFGGASELRKWSNATRNGQHEGASMTWTGQILSLMRSYTDVYADLSSSIVTDAACPGIVRDVLLKKAAVPNLEKRILFGSDYFMSSADTPRTALAQRLEQVFTFDPQKPRYLDARLTELLTYKNALDFLF